MPEVGNAVAHWRNHVWSIVDLIVALSFRESLVGAVPVRAPILDRHCASVMRG